MSSKRRKPLPQEPVTVEVTGLGHDGRGIARVDNKVVFVFGGLPGETVRAKYTRVFSRYSEANTVEVIKASPLRIKPLCEHFSVCGGCQMQHLAPSQQIKQKQKFLEELLVQQSKVTPKAWLAPLEGNFKGYRQKARLGVRFVDKKDALLVGFREQGNNKIAMIDSCSVLDERVGNRISALRDMINSLEGKTTIPQIEIAIGGDEVALVFRHLEPLCENDLITLTSFCQSYHFSLYLQPAGVESVHKIWPETGMDLSYRLDDQDLTFHFHPLDFTQVNQDINQKMINQALMLLNPKKTETILDLFCGLGNFSLSFARYAKHVVGVEGTEQMVARAKANAQFNQLENVNFHAFDLSKDFSSEAWAQITYDKIVLDPPRCGAQEIVTNISQFKAKEILYISCNPATFARDAAILVHQHGYHLVSVGVMDMFPHTAHVETIGLFQL